MTNVWKWWGALLLIALLAAAGGCGDDAPAPARSVKADVGYSAPDFEMEDLAGDPVKLSDYRGKVVVLNFWATWCGPCRIELPILKGLPDKHSPDELVVLAVDLGEERDDVARFAVENDLQFIVLLDPQRKVGNAYRARTIPTTYVIDADGVIQYRRVGPLLPNELDLTIRPLIAAARLAQ